jgi:3-hydroxybutyryl-CoA dehydratase
MAPENSLKSPRLLTASDIHVGMTASFDHLVDVEMATSFSELSGDYNPLHNDRGFANKLGYKDRVAHGAIQQALISRFAGMYIPGVFSVIKRLSTAYSKPIIVGDLVRVTGIVVEWVPEELS